MHLLTGAISIKLQEKLFRNIKYEIILEVFRSIYLQEYEKEYWRLTGYKRAIREDHQNCLFNKIKIYYDKRSACENKWETFM